MRLRHAVLSVAVVATVAAVGCGRSGEQFTAAEADRATAALNAVQEMVDDGRCADAQRRIGTLATQATNLGAERPDLSEAWAASVGRLQTLVRRECVEIEPEQSTPPVTAPAGPTEREPEPTPKPPDDGPTSPPDNGGSPDQPDNNQGGQDQNGTDDSGGAGLPE